MCQQNQHHCQMHAVLARSTKIFKKNFLRVSEFRFCDISFSFFVSLYLSIRLFFISAIRDGYALISNICSFRFFSINDFIEKFFTFSLYIKYKWTLFLRRILNSFNKSNSFVESVKMKSLSIRMI